MNNTSITPITDTAISNITHLSIIKVSGDDAQLFLQGQFSNDVTLLNDLNTQLNSYNSPKGRMYAAFRLCKFDSSYYLILPTEITDAVLKRLNMFVMRSNVTLEDISGQWKTLGISGEKIQNALTEQKITLPQTPNQCTQYGKKYLINLSGSIPRALFIGPESEIIDTRYQLEQSLPIAEREHWKRLDIQAGIPGIYAATMESFVAQMINFQLVDGVSFTKGCYPGQEVIARMHYLGKLKKRMYRVSLGNKALPNDKIYDTSGENEQSVGQIVDAQVNDNDGYDALAVIQVSAADSKALKLGSLDGETITMETLPYSFPED